MGHIIVEAADPTEAVLQLLDTAKTMIEKNKLPLVLQHKVLERLISNITEGEGYAVETINHYEVSESDKSDTALAVKAFTCATNEIRSAKEILTQANKLDPVIGDVINSLLKLMELHCEKANIKHSNKSP